MTLAVDQRNPQREHPRNPLVTVHSTHLDLVLGASRLRRHHIHFS